MQDMPFTIELLPCRKDNYAFILIHEKTASCIVIDTPDGDKICDWLKKNQLNLKAILNTHHHHDHVGGNMVLAHAFDCAIYGSKKDQERITGITHMLDEGDKVSLFENFLEAQIISLDGHTIGLIGYYFPKLKALFLGDALFNLGCGYMFEGTQEQMWSSMEKIKSLPDDTLIYAAHEYSLKNAEFVEHIMPFDQKRYGYIQSLHQKREQGHFTIPTSLKDQKEFNPFLQAETDIVKQITQTQNQTDAETFGRLRAMKNNFS